MREATDICHICDKVEPTPSMTYVDAEHPHDDRLVCDECLNKKKTTQRRANNDIWVRFSRGYKV